MKAGVALSALAHAAAMAFGLVSLSAPRPLMVAQEEVISVDFIPVESVTKTIRGDEKADKADTPAPKPTSRPETQPDAQNIGDTETDKESESDEQTKNPPVEKTVEANQKIEPEPVEVPKPAPTPELAPEPQPKTEVALLDNQADPDESSEAESETAPTPSRIAIPKKRPNRPQAQSAKTNSRKVDEAKKKTEKASEDASKDKIAALLNKEDASAGGAKRSTKRKALGNRKSNNTVKLSQSEVDALRGQIQGCWNVVGLAGLDDADKLRAKVEFRLTPDGAIEGRPKVNASGGSSRTNKTFAGSARRAVISCAPYKLPREKYEDWADVVVNFSLKDML